MRLLIVEDEPECVTLLTEMLKESGLPFSMESAADLAGAVVRLGQGGIDAVLVDLGLPDSRGPATVERLREASPHTALVVVSGLDERTTIADVLERGARDYLVKGSFAPDVLARAVRNAIARQQVEEDLRDSQQRFKDLCNAIPQSMYEADARGTLTFANPHAFESFGYSHEDFAGGLNALLMLVEEDRERARENIGKILLGEDLGGVGYTALRKDGTTFPVLVYSRSIVRRGRPVGLRGIIFDITQHQRSEAALNEALDRLKLTLDGTVNALAATVELRDPYTAGHQRRVAQIAQGISREIGCSEDDTEGIHVAALLHDIGKIAIPVEVLSKPSPLSSTEYRMIQAHVKVGYDILAPVAFPWPVADIVLQHHERMDGKGYPSGLEGEDILLGARILAVADTVEAMSSHRPYRAALGIEKALDFIREGRATLFDARIVDACLALFEQGKITLD